MERGGPITTSVSVWPSNQQISQQSYQVRFILFSQMTELFATFTAVKKVFYGHLMAQFVI
jgi:hypothetical protein